MSYTINQDNFTLFVTKLAHGWNRAQSYSSSSFGSTEVARARALQYLLDEFVDRVEKNGFCPVATIHPVFAQHEMYVNGPVPNLKQEIDNTLHVVLSDLQQAVDFCEFAYSERETTDDELVESECATCSESIRVHKYAEEPNFCNDDCRDDYQEDDE
jgi:hypothetical protein